MNVRYQNNQTGEAFDVTELVRTAKWTTKRTGAPAQLDLTLLRDAGVVWSHGGVVSVLGEGGGLFYGYVFKITYSEDLETVGVTAYDQTRYLKNKHTYEFVGVRADQVLTQIAEDYRLKLGALPSTGYVIPYMRFDIKTLFDIVLEALDRTLINSGRMFYLWDDFGALRLSEVAVPQSVPIIGGNSLATGFSYETSIDEETYNKIKLVQDNESTGRRDAYIVQDSNNMKLWGVLQLHEKASDGLNAAQIKAQCQQMLELYNRPKQTLSLSSLALPGLRAGQVVYCSIPGVGIAQTFLVEEAEHDLAEETMELKVKVI